MGGVGRVALNRRPIARPTSKSHLTCLPHPAIPLRNAYSESQELLSSLNCSSSNTLHPDGLLSRRKLWEEEPGGVSISERAEFSKELSGQMVNAS